MSKVHTSVKIRKDGSLVLPAFVMRGMGYAPGEEVPITTPADQYICDCDANSLLVSRVCGDAGWTLQQDFGEGQAPATVRDFLMEHKGGVFSLMTPCGYVSLTEAQAESLLDGHGIKSHPGVAGVSMEVSADEILTQTVKSANRQNGVWYLLTESPEQTQSPPEMEVNMC